MENRWQWTRDAWWRAFRSIEADGLKLDRVDVDEYWKIHDEHLRDQFPPEVFINVAGLRSEETQEGQRRIASSRDDSRLVDPCIIRDGARVAGSFIGEQQTNDCYRMWHTNLHADYRGRGLYRKILHGYIEYTGELGFDTMTSEHAPGNNAVIIPKLSAGFRIMGIDVRPLVGVSIHLCYFHNPDHAAAYEYRCGLATMNPRILENGSGAMDQLIAQFRTG